MSSIRKRPSIVVLEVYEELIAKKDVHPATKQRYQELLSRQRKVIL